jgi:hypothetical protein
VHGVAAGVTAVLDRVDLMRLHRPTAWGIEQILSTSHSRTNGGQDQGYRAIPIHGRALRTFQPNAQERGRRQAVRQRVTVAMGSFYLCSEKLGLRHKIIGLTHFDPAEVCASNATDLLIVSGARLIEVLW